MSNRQGLSLVEVVLAMTLLVVAYLPLSELLHLTSAQTVKSRNQLIAQNLAAGLFEIYTVKSDVILAALAGTGTLHSDDFLAQAPQRELLTGKSPEIEAAIKGGQFKMKVDVERTLDKKLGLDRLETTLEWQEDGGKKSRTYVRIVYP